MSEKKVKIRKDTLDNIKKLIKAFEKKGLSAKFLYRDRGRWECILIPLSVLCGPGKRGLNRWHGEGRGVKRAAKAAMQQKKKSEEMFAENPNLIFYWS